MCPSLYLEAFLKEAEKCPQPADTLATHMYITKIYLPWGGTFFVLPFSNKISSWSILNGSVAIVG